MLADGEASCEVLTVDCGGDAISAACADRPERPWIALHEPDVSLRLSSVASLVAEMRRAGAGVGFGALDIGAGRILTFPEERRALRWRRVAAARAGLLSRPALANALGAAGWREDDPLRLHRLLRAAVDRTAPVATPVPLATTQSPLTYAAAILRFEQGLALAESGVRAEHTAAHGLVLLYGEPSAVSDRVFEELPAPFGGRLRHQGPGDPQADAAAFADAALVVLLPDLRFAAGEGLAEVLRAVGTPYVGFADAAHARGLTQRASVFQTALQTLFDGAAGLVAAGPEATALLTPWGRPIVAAPEIGAGGDAFVHCLDAWASGGAAASRRVRRLGPPWRRVALAGEPPPPSPLGRLARGAFRRFQASMAAR